MYDIVLAVWLLVAPAFAQIHQPESLILEGDSFSLPETQNIDFVPLMKVNPSLFEDRMLPRKVDLRELQSKVRSQGSRGACTYFVFTSLVESLMKIETNRELDLSEEYLAWAGKVKMNLRVFDEGASIAVNAVTFQKHGFMLERDMPYQPSWLEKGYPCEGQNLKPNVDPICFSHLGPESSKPVFSGRGFVFETVNSRSIDVVRELAFRKRPVTLSLSGHREMWDQSKTTGDFFLSPRHKRECQENRQLCSGHAVLATGYDLDRKVVFIKNSWGEAWGNRGYGTIPFDYLDQMSPRKFLTGSALSSLEIPEP